MRPFTLNGVRYSVSFRYETLEGPRRWRTVPGVTLTGLGGDPKYTRVQVKAAREDRRVSCCLFSDADVVPSKTDPRANRMFEVARGVVKVNPKMGYCKATLRLEAVVALIKELKAQHGVDKELLRLVWHCYETRGQSQKPIVAAPVMSFEVAQKETPDVSS